MVFFLELGVLVISRQHFFNAGKVGSSFQSQLDVVLYVLMPYLIPLFIFMVSIYLFFAWGNFQIWLFLSQKNRRKSKNIIKNANYIDLLLFCALNFLFFFCCICL